MKCTDRVVPVRPIISSWEIVVYHSKIVLSVYLGSNENNSNCVLRSIFGPTTTKYIHLISNSPPLITGHGADLQWMQHGLKADQLMGGASDSCGLRYNSVGTSIWKSQGVCNKSFMHAQVT